MMRRGLLSLLSWGVVAVLFATIKIGVDASFRATSRRCVGLWLKTSSNLSSTNEDPADDDRPILLRLQESTTCDSSPASLVGSNKRRRNESKENRSATRDDYDYDSQSTTKGTVNDPSKPYRVMMMLSDQHEISDVFATLAAGFLTAGLHVTVVYFHAEPKSIIDVQFEIFSRIHVRDQHRADKAFAIVEFPLQHAGEKDSTERQTDNLNEGGTENSPDDCSRKTTSKPFDDCAIQKAPSYMRLLETISNQSNPTNLSSTPYHQLGEEPDVLVSDAAFMGGMLFSEVERIPTVAFGSYETLDLAIEHDVAWYPAPDGIFPYRMYQIVRQRLYSLSLTEAFLKTNRMRKELGLPSHKSPTDILLPVVALFVEFIPSDSLPFAPPKPRDDGTGRRSSANRVHQIQPLLSPCTPCVEEPPIWAAKKNTPIVMVQPPERASASWVRSLIRSLTLARQSLDDYDECSWDTFSCRKDMSFEVVWLQKRNQNGNYSIISGEPEKHFPPVVPSFIHKETSINILDSVIRHPNTVVAMAHCNSDLHTVSALGVGIFCLSHTSCRQSDYRNDSSFDSLSRGGSNVLDPREVATQLLRLLRQKSLDGDNLQIRKNQAIAAHGIPHGMDTAVVIVSMVAQTHRENKPWASLTEMQQTSATSIMEALERLASLEKGGGGDLKSDDRSRLEIHFDEKQPYDAFTVLIAWVVFLSALTYVLMKDSIARWRRRKPPYRGDSLSDGIFSRLPDLDEAWDTLVTWYREQPVLAIAESFTLSRAQAENQNIKSTSGVDIAHSASTPQGNQQPQHHNHHQGHVRRRRKVKTTRQ